MNALTSYGLPSKSPAGAFLLRLCHQENTYHACWVLALPNPVMSIHLQKISVSLPPSLNFPSTKSHHLECSGHSSKWEGRLPNSNQSFPILYTYSCHKKKRSDQKNLREERIYLMYTFRSHSIAEGRQGKLSSRNRIHKSRRNSPCCLPCQIVVSWLSYTAQGHLQWGWC